MPCGVTKNIPNVGTVTCDNAGTSAHTGLHSGVTSFDARGLTISGTRVYWLAADTIPARQAPIARGTAY